MREGQRGGVLFSFVALLSLFAFLGLIYLARRPLLRVAGGFWVVDDPLEHADAIIVLGDDNFAGDRVSRASQLFRSGMAPRIVVSGRKLRPFVSFAELMQKDLVNRGVPETAIVEFSHSAANTHEEAIALSGLIAQNRWHRILVVTSNYHTRRARYIFGKVFPSQVMVEFAAAWDSEYDPSHWWETRQSRKLFFLESVSYVLAMWELRGRASAQDRVPAEKTTSVPQRLRSAFRYC